mmetsp:Transcript_34343/g.62824  ORF Transcript_34343/g.62824 Transcript_34343/m.62824 type:complete len:130 (-) Transcript_34343:21-410(-)
MQSSWQRVMRSSKACSLLRLRLSHEARCQSSRECCLMSLEALERGYHRRSSTGYRCAETDDARGVVAHCVRDAEQMTTSLWTSVGCVGLSLGGLLFADLDISRVGTLSLWWSWDEGFVGERRCSLPRRP